MLLHPRLVAAVATTMLLPAQNPGDYFVDGIRGLDVPGAGTPVQPWKTITYAIAQIPPVTGPNGGHTLFVEGNQVYSPATNGETLPIRPAYNLWIEGTFAGHGQMPVVRPVAGGTGIRYDPAIVYSRNQSTLRYLVFEGGDYGIAMGNSGSNRHRPRVEDCVFRDQAQACVRIDDAGPACGIDPRFFHTTFSAAPRGIEIAAAHDGAVVLPDVAECTFRNLDAGIRLDDASTGGHVGGTFRSNWFATCVRGIWIDSHSRTTATDCRVASSSFRDVDQEAVLVLVNGAAGADASIERTSFLRCGTGVRLGGTLASGRCTLTLADSTIHACTSVGLRIEFGGTGSCSFTSTDNVFQHCDAGGISIGIDSASVQFAARSLRDRMLQNSTGLILYHGSGASAVRFESAMVCSNAQNGIAALAPFTAHSLTFADNGIGLLTYNQGNAALLDHCVFAGNGTDVLGAPEMTWSCFQGSSHAGAGNLNATDPLLVRPFWKLAPGSPCIDRGNPAATLPATDYEGDPRASAGRANGPLVPDLGADEYMYGGSARRYGTPGFGYFEFLPTIGSPNTSVVVGGALTIDLTGAILPVSGVPASGAILTFGTREDAGTLPFDLGAIGAPGSLLWNELGSVVGLFPVTPSGTASLTFAIPGALTLSGQTFTFQWFANQQSANAVAPVASAGLRVTVGR
jgi:Right handed beta helix region